MRAVTNPHGLSKSTMFNFQVQGKMAPRTPKSGGLQGKDVTSNAPSHTVSHTLALSLQNWLLSDMRVACPEGDSFSFGYSLFGVFLYDQPPPLSRTPSHTVFHTPSHTLAHPRTPSRSDNPSPARECWSTRFKTDMLLQVGICVVTFVRLVTFLPEFRGERD